MFGLGYKPKKPGEIKNIHEAIKLIHFFIAHKKWDDAHSLIKLTIDTERYSLNKAIEGLKVNDIDYGATKDILEKKFNKHFNTIKKLETDLLEKESKLKFVPEAIKRFDDAIKGLNTLILLEDWEQSRRALREVREIEKKGLETLLTRLESEGDTIYAESEKNRQLKEFSKKETHLDKIKQIIAIKEAKNKQKIDKEKFKIRFSKIKNEIELLTKTGKSQHALKVLKSFLEENKENSLVIKFFNREKAKLLKSIEKQKKKESENIQKDLKLEAMNLAGTTLKILDTKNQKTEKKTHHGVVDVIKGKINIYHTLKERLKKKKLIDEVSLLIEESTKISTELAQKKLADIHKGLTKEIYTNELEGYDLYGKILGSTKISGDTFGIHHGKKDHKFFIGDATGHGVKSGLIVTLLSKAFNTFSEKLDISELAMKINNTLKQDLQSRNFITGMLFQIDRDNINRVNYVGMGHEPMLIYRKKTKKIERIIAGGLAAGIRLIKDIGNIKVKELNIDDGDIMLVYSDGLVEAKSVNEEPFGIQRLENFFADTVKYDTGSASIYKHLMEQIVLFRGGSSFDDDVSMIVIKRDSNKDLQKKESDYLLKIEKEEKLDKKEVKQLIGKNKNQIQEDLKRIKKEKELNVIINSLKKLYHIGEFLTLKQESIRFIKDGWIHKDINMYLRKAIENETKYKINLKNAKISNRYNVLEQLYKSGDFNTVIREVEDIISKEGDI